MAENDLFSLFENMPVPAVMMNRDQTLIKGNAAFFNTFKKTKRELKGKKPAEITVRGGNKTSPKKLTELTLKKSLFNDFIILYLKSPEPKQKVQKTKEHYLRVMAEHIPRSTFILFEADNRISVAKGRPLQTFGCNREKLEGKKLGQILRPQKLKEFESIMSNARKGEEYVLVRTVKDATFRIEFVPVKNDADEVVSILFISEDITVQHKADIEKNRVEKLELTQKILRNIAHEVRNPLTNINLSVDELKEEVLSTDTEPFFDIISRNTDRINTLVTKIMQSTKPAPANKEKVLVEQLISGVEREVSDRIKLLDVQFRRRNSCKDQEIFVDIEKIRTSLSNIVINAVEAVEKEKGRVFLSAWRNGDIVTFSIKDNGKGMSKKELEKIFDPFQTGKHSGMGLGLTGVMNIVKAHNGDVNVQSEPEKGTTFYVKIPIGA